MSHFKFPEFKATMDAIDKAEREADEAARQTIEENANAICNIATGENTDGSGEGTGGTHVLVKTEAYNKWLATVQKRNRFIGKNYMGRAKEFERDDEQLTQQEAMNDEELQKILVKDEEGNLHISDEYDPNGISETDDTKLTGTSAAFADLCTINNVIAKQVSWDFDSLMDEVTAALKEEHADDLDFELPENLADQVDKALKRSEAIAQITYSK